MNKNNSSMPLELTIISAESLSVSRNRPVKKNTFVVIKIESQGDQYYSTTLDTENGAYPSWNEHFSIDMPMHINFFTLEVRCRNYGSDRVLGSARVPISDFTCRYFPCDYLHFLSYRLRDRSGERNGIINLSVKMKSSSNIPSTSTVAFTTPVTGWNYGANMAMDRRQNVCNGVVIGVPIKSGYQR